MGLLRLILNIIWLFVAGFWLAVGYAVAGLICCVLIVTIPFGVASFRMANYAFWPFGRELVRRSDAGAASTVGNVIWIIVAGWWLAIGHIATALGLAVTIVGIPMAWASLKMIPVALAPFGNEIVSSETRREPWQI
ncbi:YccF domain-containing protein [Marinitenerispora sediminis]|uniref:YccF domain-containing protein n=1 Tax=Marinitenerispora sediminis TaxID=1931232 RepID=A0A368T0E5_9ACTN|nr:YccF domain-containing protein [Marinitenerispora sediminis]RCV48294.1 YccF domain-containing protein [Marinitenerispora sediminis]RCV49465.1 YccF domain-containing protein [Marinitenerispora sediminis]RCV52228.1 YccF domain-containing protein [Marinitenerispora sediminis]